jgi:hypothetical protein
MKLSDFFVRAKFYHDGEMTDIDVSENKDEVKVYARFYDDVTENDIDCICKEIEKKYHLNNLIIEQKDKPRQLGSQEIFNFIFQETKRNGFISAVRELTKREKYFFTLDIYGTRQSYTTKLSIYQFEDIDKNLDKILEMIKNKWIDEFDISGKTLTLEGCVCYK